jgi:hypothetical protein
MKLKNLLSPLICVVLLIGCNDNSSNDQSCADCVWDESSQKLVLTSQGGITGQTSKTEYNRADIPSGILSTLEELKRVSSDVYYDHWCVSDGIKTIFTVVDSDGKEVFYRSNRLECENPSETLNYIDHYEMQNIIQLFHEATLAPVWSDASERFEILVRKSDSDNFVSIVDFTSDTLPDDLRRRLPSLSYVTDERMACPGEFGEYVLRVTDSNGLFREYTDEISANCNSELDETVYVSNSDIVDILIMVDQFDLGTRLSE